MKDATISELYDLTQTIAAKIFEGKRIHGKCFRSLKILFLNSAKHSIRQNTKTAAKMSGSQRCRDRTDRFH